jgi:hypothetical protein
MIDGEMVLNGQVSSGLVYTCAAPKKCIDKVGQDRSALVRRGVSSE